MRDFRVEDLLKRLGIEAKRRGKEWFALCPNPRHDDHSPSWRMRDDEGTDKHGLTNCFVCNFGGSAVQLVAALKGISFEDAEAFVYEGVERVLPGDTVLRVAKSPIAATGFVLPAGVRFGPLETWAEEARAYAERRGLGSGQLARWGVGYAMEGWLEGRLVFPKRTTDGKIVGYSARTFRKHELVRYLEPVERENPDRSVMFGEEWWFGRDVVFVSEGAINGLALERSTRGMNIAALSGSDLSSVHAAKIAQFKHVVLARDPDAAGMKICKALYNSLCRHTDVSFLDFEPKQDPASVGDSGLREMVSRLSL